MRGWGFFLGLVGVLLFFIFFFVVYRLFIVLFVFVFMVVFFWLGIRRDGEGIRLK